MKEQENNKEEMIVKRWEEEVAVYGTISQRSSHNLYSQVKKSENNKVDVER